MESAVWNTVCKTTRKLNWSVSNTEPELSGTTVSLGQKLPKTHMHPSHPEMSGGAKVARKPENGLSIRRKNEPEYNGSWLTQVKF